LNRLAVAIEISSDGLGGLNFRARSVDDRFRLETPGTALVLTLWLESPDTLRGRVEEIKSRATGYFQGNATLLEFGNKIGLRVVQTGAATRILRRRDR
jgi:hypothetical protein